ncbi:hypothetical protein [Nannocystis pusilla]|uniref:hypothetical protein n=1 Tax=Nannocystis pusilla TaxID=889268 RepID=UPI003B782458
MGLDEGASPGVQAFRGELAVEVFVVVRVAEVLEAVYARARAGCWAAFDDVEGGGDDRGEAGDELTQET